MNMNTRAGAMMEALGGVSDFSEQARITATVLAESADDFATADEMVAYINEGIPKTLHDKGNVIVRKERGLGKHGLVTVKYLSNDFRENPRLNGIEHNAFYRIIFMLHQQPETPDPRAKIKFEIVTGVSKSQQSRIKNPRFMPQKSFRLAADKVVEWFKKNEKALLDWSEVSEAIKSADGKRGVIGTAVVSHGRVSVEVPIYKGDKDSDITSRAVDHLAITDPGKRLYVGSSTEIKRHMLDERAPLPERIKQNFVIFMKRDGYSEAQALEEYDRMLAAAGGVVFDNRMHLSQEAYIRMSRIGASFGLDRKKRISIYGLLERAVNHATFFEECYGLDEGVRGKVQQLIMDFVQAAGPDAKVSVNSLSRRREFLGIDYGRILKGYEQLQKAGLIDVETETGVDTYLTLAEEYLCEGRIGRFFLTAPTLTRKTFLTDMMRHVYALQQADQDDAVLRAALIKADKAVQFWLKAERASMGARLSADEVKAYGAELDVIEGRLKNLRKVRTGARAEMRNLYKDVLGLYGF